MALGSGTFTTRNKTFPGIYIRLARKAIASQRVERNGAFLGWCRLGEFRLGDRGDS